MCVCMCGIGGYRYVPATACVWRPDDNFVLVSASILFETQDVLWFPISCARLAGPRTSGNPPASHLSVTALGIKVHMTTPGCPRVLRIWTQILRHSECFICWAICLALKIISKIGKFHILQNLVMLRRTSCDWNNYKIEDGTWQFK